MAVLLLFTMNRAAILAEEVHDHAPDLSVRASASPRHVYVGDGAVAITVDITGGTAPYMVTIQAVQGGAAVHSEYISPAGTAALAYFVPECFGDYELVAFVCDAQNVRCWTRSR